MRSHLARLKGWLAAAGRRLFCRFRSECPGCAGRKLTMHDEYKLPGGDVLTVPPIPDAPPCTCGRGDGEIVAIVIVRPDEITEKEAKRLQRQP